MKYITILSVMFFSIGANASAFDNLNKNIHTDRMLKNNKISNQAYNLAKKPGSDLKHDELVKQAKDLEAVLLSSMIEPMFPDGKDSNLYGGGPGSDVHRMLMIQEYGKILSNAGGVGIAKNIEKDLTR